MCLCIESEKNNSFRSYYYYYYDDKDQNDENVFLLYGDRFSKSLPKVIVTGRSEAFC